MKTVRHYNFELEVSETKIEYYNFLASYELEKFELGEIKHTIVSLPRAELVDLVESELGKKSLKWFQGLFAKLEKAIEELHA